MSLSGSEYRIITIKKKTITDLDYISKIFGKRKKLKKCYYIVDFLVIVGTWLVVFVLKYFI
jgi:hypothetical protein